MSDVFVSYSRWDRKANKVIDRLLDDLRAAGVELWLAPDSVAAGTDFSVAIETALSQAQALLVLYGSRSPKARGLERELESAVLRGLPVYCVQIEDGVYPQMPAALAAYPQFALYENYEAVLRQLLEELPAAPQVERKRDQAKPTAPRSKGYVFISYAERDSAFVTQLRQFLKERGYGYWDYQDSDRNYHTQLFLELEEVIQGAAATISVLSPDWKQSKWAAKEYIFSEEVGVPVFLVMAREMGPTLVTAGIAYIDFTRDPAAGFARLDRELNKKGLI
jgi:hypothetical protein